MPPKQIAGRYDVLHEIGRGGMGSVWLCTDRVLGREVAVKQVGGLPGESTPHVARAMREARSSAALNHPHVVALYDAVEDGDHLWLVMEYLPSRTLSQLVKEDGALPPARVARIGAQAADGLCAAHARGTVHRDVKPGNILVTSEDVAKISDFGLARTLGDDQLTQTGLVSGTPLYFSPELARGATPSPAADVWALGASLFAAVEGGGPWPTQENAIAMLVHIAGNEPPVPRHAGPLTGVIRQMMQVDPARRPSMEQARDRLRAIVTDPSSTGAPAPDGVESTRVMRVPGPSAGAAASTPVAATPVPAAATARPTLVDPDRRRRRLTVLVAAVAVLALVVGAALVVGLGGGDESSQVAGRAGTPSGTARPDQEQPPTSEDPDSTDTPESSEPAPPVIAAEDPAAFVESYYAQLPGDTDGAWEMLDPGYQDEVGTFADYRGFWATIDSVTVGQAVAGDDGVVEVTLTYVTDGNAESESRRITVAETEDGQRIVADAVG